MKCSECAVEAMNISTAPDQISGWEPFSWATILKILLGVCVITPIAVAIEALTDEQRERLIAEMLVNR